MDMDEFRSWGNIIRVANTIAYNDPNIAYWSKNDCGLNNIYISIIFRDSFLANQRCCNDNNTKHKDKRIDSSDDQTYVPNTPLAKVV